MAATLTTPADEQAAYLLRTEPLLWARFKARADADGIPLRTILVRLIEGYVDEAIALPRRQPARVARRKEAR